MSSSETAKNNSEKLKVLVNLRKAAGRRRGAIISQEEVAKFFHLKHKDTVSAWEIGESRPPEARHRDRFITYLLDKLELRKHPNKFTKVWDDVMVQVWGWQPLEVDELRDAFPGRVRAIRPGKRNTITITMISGEQYTMPFLAPPSLPHKLIGRDDLLRELKQRLFAGGTLALTPLNGMPGIGKTALATALVHDDEVLTHFRDGVLWASVGRDGNVLSELGRWAKALGISSTEIAELAGLEERTKAVLAAIGLRRMLLVADDVWEVEAAKTFRLTGPNCAYIFTTRLRKVAAGEVSEPIVVTELSEDDGVALLSELAPDAVKAEPEKTRALVRAVGGLPLSILLMGHRLQREAPPDHPRLLEETIDKLNQAAERLRTREPQAPAERHPSLPLDVPISLETMIGISYEALDKELRSALRALAVFPHKPNTFSEEAAVAVCAQPARILDELSSYILLENSKAGRYTMHNAIADYARVNLTHDQVADQRMVDFFIPYVENHETGYDALDLEYNNIVCALEIAANLGMHTALVRGANSFSRYLATRGLYEEAEEHLTLARRSSESSADKAGLATTLFNLGKITEQRGDFPQAEKYYLEGLKVARESEARVQMIDLLNGLSAVAMRAGEFPRGEAYLSEALPLAEEIDDRRRLSKLLTNLGALADNRGDYSRATELNQRALLLAQEVEDRGLVSGLLGNLGLVAYERGDFPQAEKYYLEGLKVAREIKDFRTICGLLTNLNEIARKRGNYTRSKKLYQEGLAIAKKFGHREDIATLLLSRGQEASQRGDIAQAENLCNEALSIAREIEYQEHISEALAELGVLASRRKEYHQAENYLQQALTMARDMGHNLLVSNFLNKWGALYLEQRNLDGATKAFSEALETARQRDTREYIATAIWGLAQVASAQANNREAYSLGLESQSLFEAMGHYLAPKVKQWVASLSLGDSQG